MKKALIIIAAVLISATATFAQGASFESFLQQFPKATLPYTLGEQDLRNQLERRAQNMPVEKANRLAWEYYEFIPTLEADARESRMPVYPEPIALLETSTHYAVVFNTGRNFARQYKTYNIAVYTKDGQFVAARCIAGVNPTAMASATIDENLNVTVKEYRVEWSKDFNTTGFDGNSILGITHTTTRTVNATAATVQPGESWDYRFKKATTAAPTTSMTAQVK
jgi:hypothetical protein